MKKQESHNNFTPIDKLAAASGRGLLHTSSSFGNYGEATTRQKKHEMLLTFMENAKSKKRRPSTAKPKLLRTLLSLFF